MKQQRNNNKTNKTITKQQQNNNETATEPTAPAEQSRAAHSLPIVENRWQIADRSACL